MAKVITEANDKVDTPVAGLLAELAPLSAMKGVPPFKATAKGDGVWDIWMNPPVKDGYMDGDGRRKEGTSSVGQASRSIEEQLERKGEAIVTVSSRKDAEILLREFTSGSDHIGGYMDTTPELSFSPEKSASDFLPRPSSRKRGTYHWDDYNPNAKIGDHAIHGSHLQIHTFEGLVIRIFY